MEKEDQILSGEMRLKMELMKSTLATSVNSKSKKATKKTSSENKGKTANKKENKKENKNPNKKATKSTNKNSKALKETKKATTKKQASKKKGASEEIDTETDVTTRKWDDSKGKEFLKGQFTPEEEKKVLDAFCEYAFANDLDEQQLINLITERQTKKDNSMWTKISESLPNRSVQSIHNYCHRKLNPYNYKGDWQDEEIQKLIQLQAEHGNKWELISKELERTATNVKDKFKQIGGKNFKSRVKEFNLALCLKLLKYIENWLDDSKILKYTYKFRNDVDQKFQSAYYINEEEKKILIDNSIKDTTSRVIIRNILKMIVDAEILEKVVEEKLEISWSFVSQKFILYSATDCKNNFDKILREFDLVEKSQIRKDLKMIKLLLKCEYDSLEEVNFSLIKNKRTPEENKIKLEELVRLNDIYSVKTLNEILLKAQGELEGRLHLEKNEVREFEEELKKNKPFDIGRVFRDFLNKKRGR